jgi:predicted DNA binding CopG/RHH family protein
MTPERFEDPFDDMSDEELDEFVSPYFERRPESVSVSMRIPAPLLRRIKRIAAQAGRPYQTFMKELLEAGVSRIERGRTAKG